MRTSKADLRGEEALDSEGCCRYPASAVTPNPGASSLRSRLAGPPLRRARMPHQVFPCKCCAARDTLRCRPALTACLPTKLVVRFFDCSFTELPCAGPGQPTRKRSSQELSPAAKRHCSPGQGDILKAFMLRLQRMAPLHLFNLCIFIEDLSLQAHGTLALLPSRRTTGFITSALRLRRSLVSWLRQPHL